MGSKFIPGLFCSSFLAVRIFMALSVCLCRGGGGEEGLDHGSIFAFEKD